MKYKFALVIAFIVTLIILQKVSDVGDTIAITRPTPSGDDIRALIDDTPSREFFSDLKITSAKDLGGQDSAIVSTWCGAPAKNMRILFEIGAFSKVELSNFVKMPSEISEKFDVYGVRSLGYRDIGIAARNGADCVNLYIVNTL